VDDLDLVADLDAQDDEASAGPPSPTRRLLSACIPGRCCSPAIPRPSGREGRRRRRRRSDPLRDPARIGRQEAPSARPNHRLSNGFAGLMRFYTSSTLFDVMGWYEAVRSGGAAVRRPSSEVLHGTPWYGLAGPSEGS
jgi:hypothetical protein